MPSSRKTLVAILSLCITAIGCGHSGSSGTPDGASVAIDASTSPGIDAHVAPPIDATVVVGDDGTPTRQTCTSSFGSGLTSAFGRLDGYLVAVVPPGNMSACNDDDSHVHLQIQMNGSIYDIAIDATDAQSGVDDVHTEALDLPLPGGLPWAEGWHTGESVDYPTLGVHSADIPLDTKAEVVSTLQSELATVNHISLYATGYGPDGAHLVHRNGSNHDGLLVTQPLSSPAHVRFFAFSDQSF